MEGYIKYEKRVNRVESTHLPPIDAWKIDPSKIRRFYAPTDDRGIVLPDATVEVVRELFEEDYVWPMSGTSQAEKPDIHHFHWMARQYSPEQFNGRTVPARFREIPTLKGVMPRQFHNVIHEVTLPPAMPKYIHMKQHLQAYHLAGQLFKSAEKTIDAHARFRVRRASRQYDDNEVADKILQNAFDRQFRGYRMSIEQLLGASGLHALQLNDPKFLRRKPHEMKRLLSNVAVSGAMNFVPSFRDAA